MGFDDSSDLDALLEDPKFQAELKAACNTALKRYHSAYDREDLYQDVVIAIRKSKVLAEYAKVTNAKGYIYRIALNLLISQHRSPTHPPPGKTVDPEEITFLTDGSIEDEIHVKLAAKEILALLKPNERPQIELWMEGYRMQEIADMLGVTRKTISTRQGEIIKKIQQRLKQKIDGTRNFRNNFF